MDVALASEVLRDRSIPEILSTARSVGYDGVEIAPFHVCASVEDLGPARRKEIAGQAKDLGIRIVGLHWLLASPPGLHLSAREEAVRRRTTEYLGSLLRFAGDLGGDRVIFGSPNQRSVEPGEDPERAWKLAAETLRPCGPIAGDCGVRFLIEPLHPAETNFINTVEEALRFIEEIDHPSFGLILDCKAMSGMPDGIEGTLKKFGGLADHFHANEPSGLGPGMGDVDFDPILEALVASGYRGGWLSIEPFSYDPDPVTVARRGVETLRASLRRVAGSS